MKVRTYRHLLVTAGQASPPDLGHEVVAILKELISAKDIHSGLSVVDVGCGLGHQMALIKGALPDLFSRVEGIDWSPATVERHKNDPDSVYDKVTLCGSDRLPYGDRYFDVAISMENIEHLYDDICVGAVAEMARVASRLIVTTPLPSQCINFAGLYPEIVEAIMDDVPLSEHDFICLESAVHKSTVFPSSMVAAGFSRMGRGHGYYVGESNNIDVAQIRSVGIDQSKVYLLDADGGGVLKSKYLRLLAQSAELHKEILVSPHNHEEVPAQPDSALIHEPVLKRKRSWVPKILRKI
jgi:SAM-dependent methyltransferase